MAPATATVSSKVRLAEALAVLVPDLIEARRELEWMTIGSSCRGFPDSDRKVVMELLRLRVLLEMLEMASRIVGGVVARTGERRERGRRRSAWGRIVWDGMGCDDRSLAN